MYKNKPSLENSGFSINFRCHDESVAIENDHLFKWFLAESVVSVEVESGIETRSVFMKEWLGLQFQGVHLAKGRTNGGLDDCAVES